MIEEIEYTVLDWVSVCEQEAYYMTIEGEWLPRCKSLPNNPRVSIDGTEAIATGIFDEGFTKCLLTYPEASALMQTTKWKATEEAT